MNKIATQLALIALALSSSALCTPAYAQTTATAHNQETEHQEQSQLFNEEREKILHEEQEVHELDLKRNEALRSNNTGLAETLQTTIDQKRQALYESEHTMEKKVSDEESQRREAYERCSKDPACTKQRKIDQLNAKIESSRRSMAYDEAAAARIAKDKDDIAKLEAELAKLK